MILFPLPVLPLSTLNTITSILGWTLCGLTLLLFAILIGPGCRLCRTGKAMAWASVICFGMALARLISALPA